MLKKENLKAYIDELIKEVEEELDESNVTGNVDGYQTPFAFSGKNGSKKRKKTATQLGYTLVDNDVNNIDESVNEEKVYIDFLNKKKGFKQDRIKFNSYEDAVKWARKNFDKFDRDMIKYESVNEGKSQRPVNRWLELKNDESMHANKKLAVGLKELKHQLSEVEKFFRWYNQIKTMNELSSDTFWKRTHGHIYKIKERLINIAKTIQEIEK